MFPPHARAGRHFSPSPHHHSQSARCVPTRCGTQNALPFVTISRSLRHYPGVSHEVLSLAPLNEFAHGGYADVFLGEARKKGSNGRRAHCSPEQYRAGRTLLAHRVHNLHLSDTPKTQTAPTAPVPSPISETSSAAGRDSSNRNTFVVFNVVRGEVSELIAKILGQQHSGSLCRRKTRDAATN